MSYRSVNFVTNGFSASNYTPAGPFGNQFITPYGDPYRVQAVGGIGDVIGSIVSGIGKVITPLLPIATPIAGAAVSSLLVKKPQAPVQSTPQSRFDVAAEQAASVQASASADKSNQTVYLVAGGVAILALFYFMSKRRK
jgi:hypothetical protein